MSESDLLMNITEIFLLLGKTSLGLLVLSVLVFIPGVVIIFLFVF